MHPDVSLSEKNCPKCQSQCYERECDDCDEFGFTDHECGEDCCACLDPEPNVRCDHCGGNNWLEWCPVCGWDLIFNQYINGIDERERASVTRS